MIAKKNGTKRQPETSHYTEVIAVNKKATLLICAAAVLIVAAGLFFVPLFGSRPFKDLHAEEVASIELTARPPDITAQVAEQDTIQEIISALNQVVIYQKSDEWRYYAGQYVQFVLTMKSGERVEVAAYNPFVIIDGQGYKTKYEPCEELNRLANAYLAKTDALSFPEDFEKLLGVSLEQIHELLGEPDGTLSGLWGDIYELEDGTMFIVYYEDGCVRTVKSGDMIFQAE